MQKLRSRQGGTPEGTKLAFRCATIPKPYNDGVVWAGPHLIIYLTPNTWNTTYTVHGTCFLLVFWTQKGETRKLPTQMKTKKKR